MPDGNYLKIFDSEIYYLDAGKGDPLLFLHGNPTSSYLWRNVIPWLKPHARCIVPDLIGHGKSGKPECGYRFLDHYQYLESFIEKLHLKNLTLVLHDWGSALGFYYAMNHPDDIKGLAFTEAIVRPWNWHDLKWNYALGFKFLRTPLMGEFLIYGLNAFLNMFMPLLTVRKLKREEKKAYKQPFRKRKSRKPMLIWPREIPINGKPKDNYERIKQYSKWLQQSELPKLLFYGEPGAIINKQVRAWCNKNLPNLTSIKAGIGLHYLPEDYPKEIGQNLANWYRKL